MKGAPRSSSSSGAELEPSTHTIGAEAPPPLGARLTVVGARATPTSLLLDRGGCVLGSAPGADVVIEDRAVSRSHVEVSIVRGGISVRDLGSRNGTYYLGQRVNQITLAHGASFTIGSARVLLEADVDTLGDTPYPGDELRGMIGVSIAMRRLFSKLVRLDGSSIPVLVTGESGVGKELVARALHLGTTPDAPLVCVNCGAVARELVTSELLSLIHI